MSEKKKEEKNENIKQEEKLEKKHILIDVSHMSKKSFYDTL